MTDIGDRQKCSVGRQWVCRGL